MWLVRGESRELFPRHAQPQGHDGGKDIDGSKYADGDDRPRHARTLFAEIQCRVHLFNGVKSILSPLGVKAIIQKIQDRMGFISTG